MYERASLAHQMPQPKRHAWSIVKLPGDALTCMQRKLHPIHLPQPLPAILASISLNNPLNSSSFPSTSNPARTHSAASSHLPISHKHLPRLHHAFPLPGPRRNSTLVSASHAPSAQPFTSIHACARLANSTLASSRTSEAGSHPGRPSAISIP